MRDIALAGFFCWAILHVFKRPWVGALLWTWFSIMNPHRLTWGFASNLPFAATTAIVTLLSLVWNRSQVRLRGDPAVFALVLFLMWTCVTTVFAFYPEQSSNDLSVTLKIQLMTLVCMAVLRERKHIEYFIWVMVFSIGFYGVKGGIFAIGSGGSSRVWGPSNSFIEGNNELGLAIVMTIPLMNYLRIVSVRQWVRLSLLAAMLLSSAAALATQSRGAFLAITAMGLVLWWRSRQKFLGAIVIVAAAVSLLAFMPASWEARMQTIGSYQQDASALGRITAWELAFKVANDRITGAGFVIEKADIYARYGVDANLVLTAHSIYFQALGEQGWIGLLLFLSIGALTFLYCAQLRKQAQARPETLWLRDLSGMVQVSMVGYAVGGAFLSLTYLDLPYNIMVAIVACKYWLLDERWKTETNGAFGSTSGQAIKGAATAAPGLAVKS
jgi:probable O-glycosylation ligase (exosortase A-associated)